MVPGSRWYMVIVVGLVMAVIYYAVFKWYLTRKNVSIEVIDDQPAESCSQEGSGGGNAQSAVSKIESRGKRSRVNPQKSLQHFATGATRTATEKSE